MNIPKFAKGIKDQIKEPVVVNQGEIEVDRFTGVFTYPKADERELIRIAFTTDGINKAKALKILGEQEKKDDINVTNEMIQKAWEPMNQEMDKMLKDWFIKGETDDEREWTDGLLDELLELPEYRDGLFAALKRISNGKHLKAQAVKN